MQWYLAANRHTGIEEGKEGRRDCSPLSEDDEAIFSRPRRTRHPCSRSRADRRRSRVGAARRRERRKEGSSPEGKKGRRSPVGAAQLARGGGGNGGSGGRRHRHGSVGTEWWLPGWEPLQSCFLSSNPSGLWASHFLTSPQAIQPSYTNIIENTPVGRLITSNRRLVGRSGFLIESWTLIEHAEPIRSINRD